MIYLTEGNIPLNAAYDDDIVQEANSTYQLTFKFPTNDILWQRLREEKFLTADDLHGEQDFVIFEVEKKHGYIQVYANQVMTMLNHYVVNPMSLDRQTGSTALSQFAGSITRSNPFSFFSDIDDRHTFNIDSKTAMEALTKDKHSIVGLWGGDLVRHGYQVRLLKNGGSENESLFMYKKNLSSYEHKTSTKSLRTRITFITTIRGEGENPVDKHYKVVVDSPLINKYSQIYEDVVEVNDQDVKDEASLREYGKQYFRTTLCDMLEDSIEIDVIGQSDVPVQMFDVVGVYHEYYDLDVRKKITKYNYSPMAKKLKSIGFGEFKSGLASAIGNVVSDAVKNETQHLDGIFEAKLAKEFQNADLAFDRKKEELTNQFTDEVNVIKAKAEENKRALSEEINRMFHDFSPAGLEEIKTKSDEALKKAGASEDLAKEAKILANDTLNNLNAVRDIATGNVVQFAEYKQTVSERIANLSSQMAGKANQVDFQRVRETAQLYERILGNTNNGIADNVARMAMTSQLFQVEVAKNVGDSRNFVRNADFREGSKNWRESNIAGLYFNYEHSMRNRNKAGVHIYGSSINERYFGLQQTFKIVLKKSDKITLSFLISKDGDSTYSGIDVGLHYRQNGVLKSQKWRGIQNNEITGGVYKKITLNFELPNDIDEINLMLYGQQGKSINLYISEVKLETGSQATSFTLAPEDIEETISGTNSKLEATRTQVTQLAGSYAIKNLNSAGDLINGINFAANGNNRIIGKATHISGDTLIDNAVIKSAMIDKLKTANFEAGSVTTNILGAEAVTAEKVKFDTAFIQRLVSQQAFINELFAKQATITKIQSIDFTGNHIKGGRISSLNGQTIFDLQSGWIEMNQEAVGIRNRFDGKPMQFLIFGQGSINGVPSAYTQLMSNRNGRTGIEHTSAGLQIWNGRLGDNIQTAITFYGKIMDFIPNSQGGGVSLNTETRVLSGMNDVTIKGVSLSDILDNIYDNFRNLDHDGNYSRGYYPRWR